MSLHIQNSIKQNHSAERHSHSIGYFGLCNPFSDFRIVNSNEPFLSKYIKLMEQI